MDLLEKASIILTPTAYNNGEALCVKPSDGSGDFDFSRNSAATRVNAQGLVENVQILSSNLVQNGDFSELGSELITNGSFDTDSDWSLGANWNISNGKANAVSALNGARLEQFNLGQSINRPYKVTFSVSNLTQGAFRVFFGSVQSQNITSDGDYTIYLTPTSTSQFFIFSIGTTTGSIDNVSVKEVDPNDEWSMQASWSIANGKASYNGAGNGHYIKQNASLTIGSQYIAKLDILDNSGNFRISVDGGTASYNNYTTGNGTYSFTFVASSSEFFVRASMGFSSDTLSIDNVSVIEITDDTNLPRINYEGGCGSWLFEPQSTNLIPYSEDFSNISWSKGGDVSIESGYLAPDGNNTAYKVTKTGTATPYLTRNQSLITTTTRSIYARSISGTGTATLLSHNSNTNNTFTLTEQWQRFELNNTASSSGLSTFYAADFRGSGTLTEYLVWGANATNDQDYATSYIPSNGTSVTRNSDVCTNGGSLASINSTEGTLYFEGAALANDGTTRRISLTDGSISNRVSLEFDEISNRIVAFISSNGVSQVLIYNTPNLLHFNKISVKYKQNDFAIWFNGAEVATDLFGSVPIGLNEISFETGNGSGIFYGKTKCVAVWKEALSDEELTELTTI